MNDYERIARIIRYLDDRHIEQPNLAALAKQAGLSESHFHRLFSKWAGITPKDFLQCLTLARAKELLRGGESVLNAALESGLSGAGRLHDLCVTLEAASAGEVKSGGAGWIIVYGFAESPFGKFLIASSPRGICHLAFVENETVAVDSLQKEWPVAELKRDDSVSKALAEKIFERRRGQSGRSLAPALSADGREDERTRNGSLLLRAFVRGTPFQVRVWRALLQVPPGTLTTYGRLAGMIGQPTAARAVGSAVGRNPLAYLIPCHRVIRETGVFGHYHWDPLRKRAIIAWESV